MRPYKGLEQNRVAPELKLYKSIILGRIRTVVETDPEADGVGMNTKRLIKEWYIWGNRDRAGNRDPSVGRVRVSGAEKKKKKKVLFRGHILFTI